MMESPNPSSFPDRELRRVPAQRRAQSVEVVPVETDRVQEIMDERDLGERAAIALAGTIHADLLLIDDAAGRAEAKRRNLRVTGTPGVLRAAAERGLVNVPEIVARLKATTFYADEALLKSAFDQGLK